MRYISISVISVVSVFRVNVLPSSLNNAHLFAADKGKINIPVRLQSEHQEATILPGDYLIGDLNGVVCLPKGLAERAIALMASQVEADEKIAKDIQKGKTFQEASKEHRAKVMKVEEM